jgi:hypothetical protein
MSNSWCLAENIYVIGPSPAITSFLFEPHHSSVCSMPRGRLHSGCLFAPMKILSLHMYFSAMDLQKCCKVTIEMIGAKLHLLKCAILREELPCIGKHIYVHVGRPLKWDGATYTTSCFVQDDCDQSLDSSCFHPIVGICWWSSLLETRQPTSMHCPSQRRHN